MKRNQFSPLFCDLYHLKMAQTMFENNTHTTPETYEMFIRKTPFNGAYLLCAGLGEVLEWLTDWHYSDEDINYLKSIGFREPFLKMLKEAKLEISMKAFPEGEIVFPNEPIVQVTGPAWQVLMVESGILNIINAQSLFATKASRIVHASNADGKNRIVMEMGLRRAQDMQGFTPTRAAYIGGITASSNVEAARHYHIPPCGTMAHCFIMREETELKAFKDYILSDPENASVLLDTYDTIQGTMNAIKASKETGIPLKSVRLDSGDLAYLSKQVRKLLDTNGLTKTKIVASNDLDEYTIQSLILEQQAPIDIFGVGTMLVTSADQPALGGVYKLKQTNSRDVIKVSEHSIKTTVPGATNVIRLIDEKGFYAGDIIVKEHHNILQKNVLTNDVVSIDLNSEKTRVFLKGKHAYCPLKTVIVAGKVDLAEMKRDLNQIRATAKINLSRLDETHLRLKSPHRYIAGLEQSLFITRNKMRTQALLKGEHTNAD